MRLSFIKLGKHSENVQHDFTTFLKRIVTNEDAPDPEDESPSIPKVSLHLEVQLSDEDKPVHVTDEIAATKLAGKTLADINTYREGDHIVLEDKEGNFIHKFNIGDSHGEIVGEPHLQIIA